MGCHTGPEGAPKEPASEPLEPKSWHQQHQAGECGLADPSDTIEEALASG